jgi:hypothetical protein
MTDRRFPAPRPAVVAILFLIGASLALGIQSARSQAAVLRTLSIDNLVWASTQMEVEFVRFQRSLHRLGHTRTPEALDDLRQRFDILRARVTLMAEPRITAQLHSHGIEHGEIDQLVAQLQQIDPIITGATMPDRVSVDQIVADLAPFDEGMRLRSLRVMRGNTSHQAGVRERIGLAITGALASSALACLLGVFALVFLLRGRRGDRASAA